MLCLEAQAADLILKALRLYRLGCVGPGWKSGKSVFSRRGSNIINLTTVSIKASFMLVIRHNESGETHSEIL